MKHIEKNARKRLARKVQSRIIDSKRMRVRVQKSNKYITAYVFDVDNKLLHSASTSRLPHTGLSYKNIQAAEALADSLAPVCTKNNWCDLVLDRNIYKYHGVVAAFADRMRTHKVLV